MLLAAHRSGLVCGSGVLWSSASSEKVIAALRTDPGRGLVTSWISVGGMTEVAALRTDPMGGLSMFSVLGV